MRDVSLDTLTQTFLNCCDTSKTDPRLYEILQSLVQHLHAFAKDVNLTHAEWRKGIELLTKAGEITDSERNEFVLFSDVLGLSSLVDMLHSKPGATPSSVLGPFHILGAPDVPIGGNLKGKNEGPAVIVCGTVKAADGTPIKGAELEIWQTADNGLYSNQDPDQSEYNFRAHMVADEKGYYSFTTVRPAPYMVPDDGPVGELLKGTGRHPWRPSHLHFIITADGYKSLVTEVFPSDDPYIDEDAVFGVREKLVMEYVEQDNSSEIPPEIVDADKLEAPFYRVDFDFILAKE